MFRRTWASLPKDASFPEDLKGLGYYINDMDEIRSIDNPDCYFKFSLNKNMRINERQRFAFNRELERIVHERLEKTGLDKIRMPSTASASDPHTPVFVSADLATKTRIVVFFGEPTHDLGILAGRVANGPGGIDKGSLVSVIRALQEQTSSPSDEDAPGIVLANMGQRYWWPEGKRALTLEASGDTPRPSLVHWGRRHDPSANNIPGSETAMQHVETLFREVLGDVAADNAVIDIIAVGESCEIIERYFDDGKHWDAWSDRLGSMLLLGSVYSTESLTNEAFKKFLVKRTRGYLISNDTLGQPLAAPEGNPSLRVEPLGCPCYSSSETQFTELILMRSLKHALAYMQDVALTPAFENPAVVVVQRPEKEFTDEDWQELSDEQRPTLSTVDSAELTEQRQQYRRWKRFEAGQPVDWSSDEDDEDCSHAQGRAPPGELWGKND